MTEFSAAGGSSVPYVMASDTILDAGVRHDLAAAHAETIASLGQPGEWLRSEERAALIAVVRAARQDASKPPWYRPSTELEGFDPLPAAAIDLAWRLTNHPGTLTHDWYQETVANLPSGDYYVEVVGVVAVTNALDRLASILDLAPLPIPEPSADEPTRPTIPSGVTTHWVPTAADATGPNVLRALSVSPSTTKMRTTLGAAQYMSAENRADLNFQRAGLDRRQIELIAGVTSLHNACFY